MYKRQDRILKEAGDQAADIMRKAEKNIENEREKTMADLQSRIAELAVSAARKMTGDTGHGSEAVSYTHLDYPFSADRVTGSGG